MAGNISCCPFTQEGLKNLKSAPEIIRQAEANLQIKSRRGDDKRVLSVK